MDIALPQYGIATTDAESLTRSLKHTMSTYCMINRTETGLSKALQQLKSLQDETTALSKPHARDSEVAALARLQSANKACNRDGQSHAQTDQKYGFALSSGLS